MAVFFFLVGLEIKREFVEGELSTASQAALPIVAAPAAWRCRRSSTPRSTGAAPRTCDGWAIPAATDIAFALAILTLVGNRVPLSIKVLLTAIAIIDDLGAIVIIAIFYTSDLSVTSLAFAGGCMVALVLLNRLRVTKIAPYILIGVVLVGVRAQIGRPCDARRRAARDGDPDEVARSGAPSPLTHLEHVLHPWVAFLVLPVFGFANAGVSFAGMSFGSFLDPVAFGIAAGLFIGKQIGIFGSVWLATKARHQPDAVGRDLAAHLRHVGPVRHRLHHESLHRHARLR